MRKPRTAAHRLVALALVALSLLATTGAVASSLAAPAAHTEAAPGGAASAPAESPLALRAALEVRALGVTLAREMRLASPADVDGAPAVSKRVSTDDARAALPVSAALAASIDEAAPRSTLEEAPVVGVQSARAAEAPLATEAYAIAAATALALGALAWCWPSIKHLAGRVLVAPLFAHVGRAEVFENGVRERIFALVKSEPGISASELSAQSGVSWGTTIYHLDVLEQNRMVVSVKDGRYRRYFVNGAGASEKEVISALRNPVSARIAQHVKSVPGLSQKDLASQTGLSPQALHWHANRLLKAGVVTKIRDGRVVRFFTRA